MRLRLICVTFTFTFDYVYVRLLLRLRHVAFGFVCDFTFTFHAVDLRCYVVTRFTVVISRLHVAFYAPFYLYVVYTFPGSRLLLVVGCYTTFCVDLRLFPLLFDLPRLRFTLRLDWLFDLLRLHTFVILRCLVVDFTFTGLFTFDLILR